MKLFVVSDIHGHYKELIKALKKAEFDENNDNHLLISMGDMFDRGQDSVLVYEYLKKLSDKKRAICLKGNHEPMFISYLKGSDNPFNFKYNGTKETIDDFLCQTRAFEMYLIKNEKEATIESFGEFIKEASAEIKKEFPGIVSWLEKLPYYFETEHYIFTHGSIDVFTDDWKNPQSVYQGRSGWDDCTWDNGSFFGSEINNTDKTVVIGHFDTGQLRRKYKLGDVRDHSILRRKDGRVIAIDGCVTYSRVVNVLVIDDENIDSNLK